jgi:uncharacterized protein (TIGR00299 family) protein
VRHIHLDPLGGVAGDMFAACLLHAFPGLLADVQANVAAVADVGCALVPFGDGVLTGMRFEVATQGHDGHRHHHVHWAAIRARLEASGLAGNVARRCVGIFAGLAEAEARVHGVAADAVVFHEVGAVDSIADIVAAGTLIEAVGIEAEGGAQWSVGSLPLGGGTVRTAHGLMPVPAPATALLLEGFLTHSDGISGERVTPTGAAILRALGARTEPPPAMLRRSGYGFGTRRLPGISNCLRALVFEAAPAASGGRPRALSVIGFEVDDQTGEELANGLERIRATAGVHDVVQWMAIGKKGRMTTHVQVMADPVQAEAAVEACFRQTTTIGLRLHGVEGRVLPRRFAAVEVEGRTMQVKLVERPGGVTGKVEADQLRDGADHADRSRMRRVAEQKAGKP